MGARGLYARRLKKTNEKGVSVSFSKESPNDIGQNVTLKDL